MSQSISYSQLRSWLKCPKHHHRLYITNEIEFPINKHILLGRAVHNTCEQLAYQYPNLPGEIEPLLFSHLSQQNLESEIDLVEYAQPYMDIIPDAFNFLEDTLYEFKVKSAEEYLKIGLNNFLSINMSQNYHFGGYIDLVLENKYGEIILIDWKTSTKGWNYWKRNDERYYYQMVLYKYFYHKKFEIPLEKIRSGFIVFNARDRDIDYFYPPNEWSDALESLERMIYNAYEREYYPLKKTCYYDFCECRDLR